MTTLLEALKQRPLLGDGAMGTQLMIAGLEQGNCGEAWNLTHPDRVLAIQRRYAEAGVPLEGSELPDYLPVMLEFAALRPAEGHEVLTAFRGVLELIRAALHDRGSLHAGVLDALCAALPQPTAAQVREMQRLAEEGPPAELVGLDPLGVQAPAEVGA